MSSRRRKFQFKSYCSLTDLSLRHFTARYEQRIYKFTNSQRSLIQHSVKIQDNELAQPQSVSSAFGGALSEFVDQITGPSSTWIAVHFPLSSTGICLSLSSRNPTFGMVILRDCTWSSPKSCNLFHPIVGLET